MSEVALQQDFLGAFGVLERDGHVLLASNWRELVPGEKRQRVYDLPGGRVEAGELLEEALVREWREECCVDIDSRGLLFVQEGTRYVAGERHYAWRSFFFAVAASGEPSPGDDIDALLWLPKERLAETLHAPYHRGFLRWLNDGEPLQRDEWRS